MLVSTVGILTGLSRLVWRVGSQSPVQRAILNSTCCQSNSPKFHLNLIRHLLLLESCPEHHRRNFYESGGKLITVAAKLIFMPNLTTDKPW
jgi:hypothetical protein